MNDSDANGRDDAEKTEKDRSMADFMGMGTLIGLGAALGLLLGTMLGNLAMGLFIGAALGTVTGAIVESSRRSG